MMTNQPNTKPAGSLPTTTRIKLGYAPRYKVSSIINVFVIDTTTGRVLMCVSEQYRASAELYCKWLNGLIEAHWDGDTMIFLPT